MTTRKRPGKSTKRSSRKSARKSAAKKAMRTGVMISVTTPVRRGPLPMGPVTLSRGRRAGRKRTSRPADVVALPRADYEALLARLEDLEDTREIQAAEARGLTPDALPDALVERLLAGEHPARIWREHRGLTLAQLAEQSGVGLSYISEIESKKKPGSAQALKALAGALRVDVGDLIV
jgi:hypothetical protein